jgi:hypothetical protein
VLARPEIRILPNYLGHIVVAPALNLQRATLSYNLKHFRKIAAAIALIVTAGVAMWCVHRSKPREPEYQDKRLSEWMEDVGNGQSDYEILMQGLPLIPYSSGIHTPKARSSGEDAIKQIGTNAIEVIKPMLLVHDSALRDRLDPLVRKVPWLERRFPRPIAQRQKAMAAMFCLEEDAVPFLTKIVEDDSTPRDVRCFAAYMFRLYPKESIGALKALRQAQTTTDQRLAQLSTEAIQAIQWQAQHP